MLRILGRPNSYNTQKVLWLLDEIALPFSLELYGMEHGGNKTPAYLSLNPNGLVPTLIEDDFVLWESNAILRYLAEKYGGGRVIPADLRERARGERWMDWTLTTLNPAIRPVFWGLIRGKLEPRDPAQIKDDVKKLNDVLAIFDRYLGETPYAGGASFSICDIPAGIQVYRFFTLAIERRALPNLEAWYRRLTERPAYRKRVMIGLS